MRKIEVFKLFGSIFVNDKASTALDNVEGKVKATDLSISNLGKTMTSIGTKMSSFGLGLTKFLTVPLVGAGAAVVKFADKASDLNEAQNVIENTFKKSSKAIEAWTNTTADSAGISKTASSQWVGFMGAMLKSSGVTEQVSGDMSKNLVQLTGDMSSFYNVGTSEMWEKIRSGISGETEPLKQLGINMSVANLQAYAMSQGIKKSYDQMSQSEQTTLRYNYLLSVTKDAQGDFGRTLNDSFANQARVAKLNLENLVTTMGSKFLPVVMESTKKTNEFLVALNTALKGGDASDKLGSSINSIANAIGKLGPDKIKSILGIGAALATIGPGVLVFGKLTEATGKFETGIGKSIEGISKFTSNGISSFQNFGSSAAESMSLISKLSVFEKLGPKVKKLGSNFEWMTEKIRYGSNITPVIDGISNKISGGFSKVSGIIPSNVKSIFANVSKAVGTEAPKLIAVFGDLGSKVFSGLQSIVGLSLKMIAPAALIGVLLLGLGVAHQQMGGQLDQIIANITIKGPQLIQNFTSGLLAKIPDLISTGTTLLMNLINAITANAPALINAAVAIITSLVNGVTTNFPRLIPVVLQLIQTIIIAIVDNLPKIILAGLNLLVALAQGISNNVDKIVSTIVAVVTEIIKVLIQNLPLIIEAGIKILVALIQGLTQAIPQLIAALPQIVRAIWDGLKNVDWGELGTNIIDGIIAGLKAAGSGILNTLKAIAGDALKGVKALLGIHSPSTVFRDEVGKNISLGIAEGISDVNFMQSLTDAFDQNLDNPVQAATKVAQLVSDKIQSIKDTTASAIKSLNGEFSKLNSDETISLRGVSSSQRYAIQDEYTAKKNAVKNEIQLRKEQADKEIAQIQKIGKMSKEELQREVDDRKSFVDSVNTLSSQLIEALKVKYTEEEKTQEDTLNKELSNLDKWKDESEERINDLFDQKQQRLEEDEKATEDALDAEADALEKWKEISEKNIEDVSNSKIAALQAQSNALDEQLKAEDRDNKNKEELANVNKLQGQIKFEHNDFNKVELQNQLAQVVADRNKRLQQQSIEDKKSSINKEIDTIKADEDKQKQNIKTLYAAKKADLNKRIQDTKVYYQKQKVLMEQDKKAQLDNINQIYTYNKNALDNELTDVKTFYNQKLTDANLNAEAEKLVMDNNQKEIVALLNSYGEQYKAAGQTLGDRLAEGFRPAIDNIKSMIASITAEISSARDDALNVMQMASDIGEPIDSDSRKSSNSDKSTTNNNNRTIVNNVSITSPVKQTPSEQKRNMESTLRRLAFTV